MLSTAGLIQATQIIYSQLLSKYRYQRVFGDDMGLIPHVVNEIFPWYQSINVEEIYGD